MLLLSMALSNGKTSLTKQFVSKISDVYVKNGFV